MTFAVWHSSQAAEVDTFSRHSNNTGLPLPFIPRRRSSIPNSQAIFPLLPPGHVTPSTTVESQNTSSQVSDKTHSDLVPEPRPSGRARAQLKILPLQPLRPVEPPQLSTFEFPRQNPVLTSSRSAQIFPPLETSPPLASDEPALTADTAIILSPSPSVDGHIRKKSGEPLKSSLKSRTPTPRPSLAIITGKPPSKSEPGTPTHVRSKSVSFAPRLDHIKLYFPQQKPIAVSRDGSPTEDTSGTESEPPVFVRRVSAHEKKGLLIMEVSNMPQRSTMDVDVMLENLILSKEATICGHVKVRNIAFEKSVAVRFTFDFWQTTSEVAASYERSLARGEFDRFSFVIRLHDILAKIEDKTLFMAIRYVVNGQELWDNNFGHNYKITFSLPIMPRPPGTIAQIQYATDEEAVANLTQKLERVQPLKSAQRLHYRQRTDSAEYFHSASLSSRYTWKESLKEPWKPVVHPTSSHLKPAQATSNSVFPWSQKQNHSDRRHRPILSPAPDITRGSPRLGDDNVTSQIPAKNPPPSGSLCEGGPMGRTSLQNHIRNSLDVQPQNRLVDAGSPGMFDLVPPQDKVGGTLHTSGGIERIPSDDPFITSSSSSSQPSPVITSPGPPSKQMESIITR